MIHDSRVVHFFIINKEGYAAASDSPHGFYIFNSSNILSAFPLLTAIEKNHTNPANKIYPRYNIAVATGSKETSVP